MQQPTSYLSQLRGVELLAGERVVTMLDADRGSLDEPAGDGRLLAATNYRLINVLEEGDTRIVRMYAAPTITGVSVRNDARRAFSWRQWAALVFGSVAVYLVLAYWLVDRLPDVVIPVINLHAVAAVLVLLIALAGWLFWRSLTRAGGSLLRVDGVNWTLELQCTAAVDDLMAFANVLLLTRNAASRRPGPIPGAEATAADW